MKTSQTTFEVMLIPADYIFVAGSGILSISIALNALSTHAVCTAIFVLVGAIVGFTFSSIRTLAKLAILTWIGCGSIIISSKCQQRPADFITDRSFQFSSLPSQLAFKIALHRPLKKAPGSRTGSSSVSLLSWKRFPVSDH